MFSKPQGAVAISSRCLTTFFANWSRWAAKISMNSRWIQSACSTRTPSLQASNSKQDRPSGKMRLLHLKARSRTIVLTLVNDSPTSPQPEAADSAQAEQSQSVTAGQIARRENRRELALAVAIALAAAIAFYFSTKPIFQHLDYTAL